MVSRKLTIVRGLFLALGLSVISVATASAAETRFTLVHIPDTQQEVVRANDTLMPSRYNWLVSNKDALNIKYMAHSGDVVNWGNVDPIQFVRASSATDILDGSGIPYGYALGNHDTAAVTTGGSAGPGNVHTNLRNTAVFNSYFPLSRFKNVGGTFEVGKVDNLYQTYSAGGVDWLNITLEMWPRTSVIEWAKNVVATHPHHNVTITTHAYTDTTGSFPTTGLYGDTSGQYLWDNLVSRYPNIKMTITGHYRGANYSERTGINGNKVAQVMTAYHADYQNHVRLLDVNVAAGTISSSVYVSQALNGQPSGYITDQYSNFVTTGMNWVQPEGGGGDPEPPVTTVPDAPTAVMATAGVGSAVVSFNAPINNGGSPITNYTVTSNPGNITVSGTGSPITVNGLTNGTSYSFTVRATNAIGTSTTSVTSNIVTPFASSPELLPDPGFETGTSGWSSFIVGNLSTVTSPVRSGARALSIAATSTTNNWVGMTNNSVINNTVAGRQYTAQCYVRPVSTATNVQIRFLEYNQSWGNGVTLQTVTTSGIPAGQWTLVKVTATANNSGDRMVPQVYATNQNTNTGSVLYDDCSVTSGTPAPVITAPGAPTAVSATASNGEAIVSFTAPASNGGSPITSYTVRSNPGNFTATGTSSPVTVTGLTNGTSYTFTVAATNSAGTSVASAPSTAVTPFAPAVVSGAPMNLVATGDNGRVALSWQAPASNGGATITDYVVQYREVGSLFWSTYTDSVSIVTNTTVNSLTNGTNYEFIVRAVNGIGSSDGSDPVTATPAPIAPNAPQSVSAIAGNGEATISFALSNNDGGSPITHYTVTSISGGITATGTDSPITVTGLTNGVGYTFSVTATNAAGTSAAAVSSVSVTPRVPATAPSVPTSLTAVEGNAQVSLNWIAPENDGGEALNDYVINYRTVGSSTWRLYADSTSVNTSATVTGLTNGTPYEFSVQAVNLVGSSDSSDTATATPVAPPATVPSIVTNVSGTSGNAQVVLNWIAPVTDGNEPITDYVIEYSVSGSGVWNTYDDGVSTGTNATITGLTNGTGYIFRVSAQNTVGNSAVSVVSGSITPRTTPDAPTNVSVVAGNGSAIVSFAPPVSNGGAAITSYTVTSNPGNVTASGTISPITVTGLLNGTSYTFTVRAINSVGTSVASAVSNSVTPVSPINELLPDSGFENGFGGWIPFAVGTFSSVTSPVNSGTKALRVTTTTTAANTLVGMTQNSVVTNTVAGKTYNFQCYVRTTSGSLNLTIRLLEYTQNYSANTKLGVKSNNNVGSSSWTLITTSGVALNSGYRMIPQIYTTNQTATSGAMLYDSCSVTTN